MQIAAQDVGRFARLTAGCAGVAVAFVGLAALPLTSRGAPPDGSPDPVAALVPAGLALLLQVVPQGGTTAGRVVRGLGILLALSAVAIGAAALDAHPGAGVAVALAGLALACLDLGVSRGAGTEQAGGRYRVADPLVAGSAVIALVELVPRVFDPDHGPRGAMPPYASGALLLLAFGVVLARPEGGPSRPAGTGPGVTVRRTLPVLIGVPVAASLVSALMAHTPISGPAAAIGTGAVLAVLAVLALIGYLVRTLDSIGRRHDDLTGELHERQEFAATLLQSMSEAVMVLDANHRVIDVNRRWRELTGYGPDEPLLFEIPPLPPAGGGDWLMPRRDGTSLPVLATVASVPDEAGVPRGYVATYVDIADRKRAEEKLSERAAELEHGNAALREANARLEAALTFKNDLTSMLTHDVAQPISSIASLSELLCADWTDLPEDIRIELATKIDRNTHRLIKMMNDLQLLFRLDTGSVTARRAPVQLLEVAQSVVATSAASDGDVDIDIPEELSVLADREHVTVIVSALLTNAVQYGEAPIRLRAERTGEMVALVLRDNGPGIADELVPQLFGRSVRGRGLGLFIVRHLAEANGGSVRYERATPHGARFVVELEAAPI